MAQWVPGSNLNLSYNLWGVWHVLLVYEWVSSMFSGFMQPPKTMLVGGFAMLNCSKVWMCVCVCCPAMDWCAIHGVLHLILHPPWPWPGYSSYWTWARESKFLRHYLGSTREALASRRTSSNEYIGNVRRVKIGCHCECRVITGYSF